MHESTPRTCATKDHLGRVSIYCMLCAATPGWTSDQSDIRMTESDVIRMLAEVTDVRGADA